MSAQLPRVMLDLAAAVSPQVFRLLRQRIIRGELEPGTRISEAEIAASYEVSRQPVREAFIKLAEEGLVEVRPQRGTFVRRIVVSEVMDARFVREAIEADIVKLLAAKPDPALGRALGRLITAQEKCAAKQDHLGFIELDERFHKTLAEAAGKSHAWAVVESVKSQMDRVRHLSTQRFPMAKLVAQHGVVLSAIMQGDPVQAEAAIRHHLRAILTDLPEVVAEKPAFFDAPQGGPQKRGAPQGK
ncbi:GntR family transcriptional regulator [uncultured Thioclava sp.]|uniref:GntR family transcriptional regulator n=1 Tax=uncultured Thioclava sp. TaxID=473858 RepID=UPI0025D44946|nr:GntR family transcriptional regulator [uncultured Thioclava sp.]